MKELICKKINLKLLLFISFILIIIIFSFVKVKASEVEFTEPITDETCISDDLSVLGIDISPYKVNEKTSKVNKVYVIAVGESYNADNNRIDTYLYFYVPFNCSNNIAFNSINYKINNSEVMTYYLPMIEWDEKNCIASNHLFKVKSFSINEFKTFDININSISYTIGNDINECLSDFSCNVSCNFIKSDNSIHYYISSKYDKTILIDEIQVVKIRLLDKNLFNSWNDFWDRIWANKTDYYDFYFYNFNMPDNVYFDDITYSKFRYDYFVVEGEKNTFSNIIDDYENIISSELKEKEYYAYDKNGHTITTTCDINNEKVEMTIPIFYLGNRVRDNQFGELKEAYDINDIDDKLFEYDCSILLDTTSAQKESISRNVLGTGVVVGEHYIETKFDNIELLELNYEYQGKEYKCQVVSKPIETSEIENIEPNEKNETLDFFNDWINVLNDFKNSDFVSWFMNNYPNSLYLIILLVIMIPVLIALLPSIITALIKLLISIISLPIKALKMILKRN